MPAPKARFTPMYKRIVSILGKKNQSICGILNVAQQRPNLRDGIRYLSFPQFPRLEDITGLDFLTVILDLRLIVVSCFGTYVPLYTCGPFWQFEIRLMVF